MKALHSASTYYQQLGGGLSTLRPTSTSACGSVAKADSNVGSSGSWRTRADLEVYPTMKSTWHWAGRRRYFSPNHPGPEAV